MPFDPARDGSLAGMVDRRRRQRFSPVPLPASFAVPGPAAPGLIAFWSSSACAFRASVTAQKEPFAEVESPHPRHFAARSAEMLVEWECRVRCRENATGRCPVRIAYVCRELGTNSLTDPGARAFSTACAMAAAGHDVHLLSERIAAPRARMLAAGRGPRWTRLREKRPQHRYFTEQHEYADRCTTRCEA